MSDNKSKASIISIVILFALILANVLLSMPPYSALSDTKQPAKEKSAKAPEKKTASNEDFGAETIEPQNNQQYTMTGAQTLPLDLAEEPLQRPIAAPQAKSDDSDVGAKPEDFPAPPDTDNGDSGASLTTSLNGNEIDIAVLVKTFSKLTKRNYIVDNTVKGKVAIHLATPVTVPEALRIFESVLLLKGFTTVPLGNNTWKVITAKDAKQTTIPMLDGALDKSSDALVTQLIRLKNTQASELQQVLAQFVSKEGMVNAFAATNALILIDSAANIKRLSKLVDQLDVPAADQDITIIPVLHAEAKDVAEKINSILGDKDKGSDNATGVRNNLPTVFPRPGMPNAVPPTNQGVTTVSERRVLPLKLIPDERTNSLICVADQILTEKVKALAEQLDSVVDRSGGKFYVYRLQHADAEDIAQIVSAVISGNSSGLTSSKNSTKNKLSSDSSDGFGSSSSSFGSSRDRDNNSQNPQRYNQANRGSSSSGGMLQNASLKAGETLGEAGKVNLEGEVTVAPDASTNSLVINASRADYIKIKDLLDDLDVKRRQVLVEATILEVSLVKSQGMGVEFQSSGGTDTGGGIAQTNFGGITNLLSNPAALTDLTIAAASSGSIVLPGGLTLPSQAILVTALSRNQNVNVLSTPTVLAIDNQEAEIKVGENVPFVSSTSTNQTNLNNTFNQIDRQDVGIKLRITPQISAGDFVVLKIFVEISDVVLGTRNDPNGPTTNIRTTETMVEVKSNQMVVTGGLIKDRVEEAARGVPFLEDIPVLGNLFRRDDDSRNRTNLLIFITPRILTDQFIARDETIKHRDEMVNTIQEQQAEPDRSEVLHSEDMDNVVEAQPIDEKNLPTPVRPPGTARAAVESTDRVEILATKRTEERIKQLGGEAPKIVPQQNEAAVSGGDRPEYQSSVDVDEEELELNVSPALPGEKHLPAAKQTAKLDIASDDGPAPSSAHTYVVLREVARSSKKKAKIPFEYADGQKTLGLNLAVAPDNFFQAGERYTFNSSGTRIDFVCLGKYDSLSAARGVHPSLGAAKKWYSLSTAQSRSPANAGWTSG